MQKALPDSLLILVYDKQSSQCGRYGDRTRLSLSLSVLQTGHASLRDFSEVCRGSFTWVCQFGRQYCHVDICLSVTIPDGGGYIDLHQRGKISWKPT